MHRALQITNVYRRIWEFLTLWTGGCKHQYVLSEQTVNNHNNAIAIFLLDGTDDSSDSGASLSAVVIVQDISTPQIVYNFILIDVARQYALPSSFYFLLLLFSIFFSPFPFFYCYSHACLEFLHGNGLQIKQKTKKHFSSCFETLFFYSNLLFLFQGNLQEVISVRLLLQSFVFSYFYMISYLTLPLSHFLRTFRCS